MRCKVGNVNACVMMQADDIVLLAPTRNAMQKLLNECGKYSKEFCLIFNANKSETIIFGTRMEKFHLYLNDKYIPFVNEVNHLGHLISNKNRKTFFNCDNIVKDIKTKCNVILSNFNFL